MNILVPSDRAQNIYQFFPPPLATAQRPGSNHLPSLKGLGIETTSRTGLPERIKSDAEITRQVHSQEMALVLNRRPITRPEALVLGIMWMIYVSWMATIQGALPRSW